MGTKKKVVKQKTKVKKKKTGKRDEYEFSDDDSLNEYSSDDNDASSSDDTDSDEKDDEDASDSSYESDILAKLDDEMDEVEPVRRIRYRTFDSREHWIKSISRRKKIRPVTKHDIEQFHNKKFFRDLCL